MHATYNVNSSITSPFEPFFWKNDFYKKTQDGKSPFLFKNILSNNFSGVKEVTEGFRYLQNPKVRESVSSRARLYIEEERHDDLASKILTESFAQNENLCQFIQRVCNVERFGLVLNNFEQLCPELTADIGKFLQSMFSVRGIPIGGCEQVVFAGNYSGTAFGVHEGYEHAFLIHLGPGIKEFYCWSKEKYLELTNGSRAPTFGDYIWMLEHGEKFILEYGDVLYLPALVYHVGRQSEFSVSVAVPLYTYPKERFFFKVILPEVSRLIPFDLEGMSHHLPFQFDKSSLSDEFSLFSNKLFSEYKKKELDIVMAYRWYRLVSNGGWEIPMKYSISPLDELSEDKIVYLEKKSMVRLIPPYKVCWEKSLNCSSKELRVFIRAFSLVLPYKEELINIFKMLNNDQIVTIDDDEMLALFGKFLQTGGLQIKEV